MHSFKIPLYSSLIARSLVSVSCLMILILGTMGYINVKKFKKDALQGLLQENLYISNITAEAIDLSLWNLDKVQIQQQLESLRHVESFCGARVKNVQGDVFVSVDFPDKLTADKFMHSENVLFVNPMKTSTARESIGTIEICSDKAILNKRIQEAVYEHLLFIMVMMISVLSACYISMLIILHPLYSIRLAMARLSDKMEPITDPSLLKQNEIGALTHTFNLMVNNLLTTYKQLHTAKEIAEKAAISKSEFLSNISHELRTPMHAILGFSRRGLEKTQDPKMQEFLADIQTSGNRLIRLLNNLLDLSKLEAGKMDLHSEECDIVKTITHSIKEVEKLAMDKNLTISLKENVDISKVVMDNGMIIQVIINLLSNAIKFTDSGKNIFVFVKNVEFSGEKAVSVSVSDEGSGIPSDELNDIFDKFVQSSKTKTGAGGTGLGLSICREIISLHGGKIWAENNPQGGSVFTFIIPINKGMQNGKET